MGVQKKASELSNSGFGEKPGSVTVLLLLITISVSMIQNIKAKRAIERSPCPNVRNWRLFDGKRFPKSRQAHERRDVDAEIATGEIGTASLADGSNRQDQEVAVFRRANRPGVDQQRILVINLQMISKTGGDQVTERGKARAKFGGELGERLGET